MGRLYGDREKAEQLQKEDITIAKRDIKLGRIVDFVESMPICDLFDTPSGREINKNILTLVIIKRMELALFSAVKNQFRDAVVSYAGDDKTPDRKSTRLNSSHRL